MADDHIHLAVASNGTLYAAVKTSYDSSGYPKIALLVRRRVGRMGQFVSSRHERHAARRDAQRSSRQADRRLHQLRKRRQHLLQRDVDEHDLVRFSPNADLGLGE